MAFGVAATATLRSRSVVWPGAPRARPGAIVLVALTAYVAVGAYWVWRAPTGAWQNRMFDFEMWAENDPGGWYIPAAHDLLLHPGRLCYAGHPGLPLLIVLAGEQRALFELGRLAGTTLDLTSFIARNTLVVSATAKAGMVILHIVSFLALYHYAKIECRRRDLALLATAIYATSFPVLYYLTRVSPEPFIVAFFLWTAVCLVKAEDASEGRALLWAALAGCCATSAFFTKMPLMAAWPLFAAGCLLTRPGADVQRSSRRLMTTGLAYIGGASAAAGVYAVFMDWETFIRFWGATQFWGSGRAAPPGETVLAFLWRMAYGVGAGLADQLGKAGLANLLPAVTKSNVFLFFEFLFLLAAFVGLVNGFRGAPRRRLTLWVLSYCIIVAGMWYFRAWYFRAAGEAFHGFHYLFPVVAALSPWAALGIVSVAPGIIDRGRPVLRRGLEMGVALVAVHYGGFFGVVDSKRQDRTGYLRVRAGDYSAALEGVSPSGRIAVINGSPVYYHGLADSWALPDRRSALIRELDDLFVVKRAPMTCVDFVDEARRRSVGAVLDFTMARPGPWSLNEWTSLATASCAAATVRTHGAMARPRISTVVGVDTSARAVAEAGGQYLVLGRRDDREATSP